MKNQYQYIAHLPSLSEEDIAQHKNFKNILDRRTEQLHRKLNKRKKLLKGGLSIALIGVITASLFYLHQGSIQKDEIIPIEIKNIENAITENGANKLDLPKPETHKKYKSQEESIPILPAHTKEQPKKPKINEEKLKAEGSDKPTFQMGYKRAFPLVGMDSLSKYFNENLKYPEQVDKNEGIEGTVDLTFTINEEGNAAKIEIQNSLGLPFDAECKRLISNMPKWEPAIRNGKAVESKVSLQLSFKIDQ